MDIGHTPEAQTLEGQPLKRQQLVLRINSKRLPSKKRKGVKSFKNIYIIERACYIE